MTEKVYVSGTMESGDAIVTVRPASETRILIESAVKALYGASIEKTVREVLAENWTGCAEVTVNDNGARDYVLRARTESAISKMKRGE